VNPTRQARRRAPCSLPAVTPDFVGRDAETSALTELLTSSSRRPDTVVAAVSGAPGTGKTALAVRTAHLLRRAFPDGQLYYALDGSGPAPVPPPVVLAELLRSLGVEGKDIPDGTADRAALYRSRLADRQVLVILDDAADIGQITPLLPGAGGSRALVTSSVRLTALEGAQPVDLPPLREHEAITLLGAVAGTARVAGEPGAALRIVRACCCLPLAVRIAGARLAMRPQLPLAVLADRLSAERTRLDELTVGELSLRARLRAGYRALPRAARRAFRLIGVLGDVNVSASLLGYELDWPEAEADRSIEALVRANLLAPVEPRPDGELRYRLVGLFGPYARERAEVEDPERHTPARLEEVHDA
jgi:NB-ARC domain-containing protein